MKRHHAVVLGGGGARGSYEIGVWKGLIEVGYDFDIVTGTSVGALNGAIMVMGTFDEAVKFWESVRYDNIYSSGSDMNLSTLSGVIESTKIFLKESVLSGGIDYAPLKEIANHYIDEETVRNSPIEFGVMTVEASNMKPKAIFKEEMEKGRLIDYCLASAACFPVMKPYNIDGTSFIDGSYNDTIPISMALQKGATAIVAVDLKGIGLRQFASIKGAKGVKIINIKSKVPLGSMFWFDEDNAKKNIQSGYFDTLKAFNHAEGGYYTFPLGESAKNYEYLKGEYRKALLLLGFLNIKQLIESAAGWRMLSVLKDRWTNKLKNKNIPLAAAECAAQILGIPYLKMYTAQELNEEILNRLSETEEESRKASSLLRLFDGNKTPKIPDLETLKLPDKQGIMRYILSRLKESWGDKDEMLKIIITFCPLLPVETIGGLYAAGLLIMKEKDI